MPPRRCKWFFPASLVPPWCLAGCPTNPFLPPWCLASCPMNAFLPPWCLPGAYWSFPPPWCLPGASQAVQLILSCFPGAFLVPIGPFLPPWCFPGASQAVELILSCLPGASLVPPWCLRLSNWSFPASLVPPRLSKESFPASLMPFRLSRWSLPVASTLYPGHGRLLESSGLAKLQGGKKSTNRKEAQRNQGGVEPSSFWTARVPKPTS